MAIIKFKKREELKILFGIRLPSVVQNLCNEVKNKKTVYRILREAFNINEKRLINLVEAVDSGQNTILILVVYNNFLSEAQKMRADLDIKIFDFDIFEFDLNKPVDLETVIAVKNRL